VVSHIRRRLETEGIWEQDAEELFVPKREEVVGGLRRLHDGELHMLHRMLLLG